MYARRFIYAERKQLREITNDLLTRHKIKPSNINIA